MENCFTFLQFRVHYYSYQMDKPLLFFQIQVEIKDVDEDDKSKGCCAEDMWYSPKGKSVPCIICLILVYIIFLPFIIVFLFAVALWWCISTIYIKMFRSGMNVGKVQ